ncbi:MAG: M20/M25/M40 family metallo-hydrolase [Gemmatimonadota bacterium]
MPPEHTDPLAPLLDDARVRAALEAARAAHLRTVADQREVAAIPAPTGDEGARADWLEARLREAGAADVHRDEAGNVVATLGGHSAHTGSHTGAEPGAILAAAHLDTVFPAGTDVEVREQDGRLLAPGISDNGRGLAALLTLARVWREAGLTAARPVVLVGTVGEEGSGDLRGARHLLRAGGPWRGAAAFVAVDGGGQERIVHRGIGAGRLRLEVHGPGGHSWSDWGRPNAVHMLAGVVARLAELELEAEPRTTLTVARIGGGTSINAIPATAWAEVDLRGETQAALDALAARVQGVLERSAQGEAGPDVRVSVIGDRPAGATPVEHPLVRLAEAATRHVGGQPELAASSTDANVAMAAGIPALALGAGGDAGGTHTPAEWFDPTNGWLGVQRCLLVLLGAATLAD